MALSKSEAKALDFAFSGITTNVDSFFKLRKIRKAQKDKIMLQVQFFLYCIMYKNGFMKKTLKELSPEDIDNGLRKTIMDVSKFIDKGILQVGDFELLCASSATIIIMSDRDQP